MSEGRLPDFLIIGAMRSGTTSLYRYLGAHPEVFLTPKELQFFTEHYDKGIDWYRARFAAAGVARVLGEATADYMARRSAMTRIAETVPDAKLIATLRNPVDRAWSHYGLLVTRGREQRSFPAAIADELTRISRDGVEASGVFYLSHGLYDVHIERCLEFFPRSQLHVSIFERMKAQPTSVYKALCAYLGVNDTYIPSKLGEAVNPYVTFRSLRVRELTQRLPPQAGRVVARLNTRRNVAPPQLDPATRDTLIDFYAPHIRRVEELIGEPVAEWQTDRSSG